MVTGAAILNAMSHNPLTASAFCLSRYYDLTPVEESLGGRAIQFPHRWKRIEIRCDNNGDLQTGSTDGSGILPAQSGPSESASKRQAENCHFIVCDGYVGDDGQIQPTANWLGQSASDRNTKDRSESLESLEQTIYISIATNNERTAPTELQIRRTEALVEELCRRCRIEPEDIRYPSS